MEMDDLYQGVFDLSDIHFYPKFSGFSYGLLILSDDEPKMCYLLDDAEDKRISFLLEHGNIQIHCMNGETTEVFYGFVDDEKMFYCEEKLNSGDIQNDEDSI